jgi:hypothetical protein
MFTSTWNGLKADWTKFDSWCASIAPGIKTHLIAGLGLLGSTGAVAQEYFTNVPLTTFVTAEEATSISAALFALVIFTRHLTTVAANASTPGTSS